MSASSQSFGHGRGLSNLARCSSSYAGVISDHLNCRGRQGREERKPAIGFPRFSMFRVKSSPELWCSDMHRSYHHIRRNGRSFVNNQHMESTNFCPDTPHFQRRILQDSLFDNKLKIPREFMVKYGSNIDTSNPIVLKVPGGGAWKIKLTKCDGHIWLGEVWPNFARHYSIQCGYSLFFRCEGQSKFSVIIIDVNDSEICYPVTTSKHSNNLNPTHIDELPKREKEAQDLDSHENFNMKRKKKLAPHKDQVNIGDSECFESVNKTGLFFVYV
ncbi:B3 domain-containing protein At1g49475-like [Cannabis sativa]|uniref:B3 domain-containing protein At1g49475-like n=1 Tax=Cannabis sativa TaxID=3483 RepID=UPI0029CA427B|nr:B3 domain-containing protein At1g49475-like [Cannabis sativa]